MNRAEREALQRLLPDFRTGLQGETGEAFLSMTWDSPADMRAFFALAREACADSPDVVARLAELEKRLKAGDA